MNSNTTAYRTWGGASGKFGHWISPKNYGSAARSMLSLPPVNTAANTSQFLISLYIDSSLRVFLMDLFRLV